MRSIGALDPDVYANGDPHTFGLPLDDYEWLRESAPCFKMQFGDPLLIDELRVISRHEDVWAADRNPELWAADRGFINIWRSTAFGGDQPPGLISTDGPQHRRMRNTVNRGFTPRRTAALEPRFREFAQQVVRDALAHDGPIDFVATLGQPMPMRALGEVMGIPAEDRERFFGWVAVFSAPFDPRVAPSPEYVENAIRELAEYTLELAERRRTDPGEDVVSAIVTAQDEDHITSIELIGIVANIAAGAAESTANVLAHGLHQLMLEPEKMAWLRERADDVPMSAVQEMIRIASPFTHLVRTATRDTTLHGEEIAAGENVALLFAAANFDPEVFDDPRAFDPARDPNPHVSFGRGPHACLGKHVAALEIKVFLEVLLQHTRLIEPAGDIDYVRDAFARGVYGLPISLTAA